MTVLLVNAMEIFPSDSSFYSDIEQERLRDAGNNPLEIFNLLIGISFL